MLRVEVEVEVGGRGPHPCCCERQGWELQLFPFRYIPAFQALPYLVFHRVGCDVALIQRTY